MFICPSEHEGFFAKANVLSKAIICRLWNSPSCPFLIISVILNRFATQAECLEQFISRPCSTFIILWSDLLYFVVYQLCRTARSTASVQIINDNQYEHNIIKITWAWDGEGKSSSRKNCSHNWNICSSPDNSLKRPEVEKNGATLFDDGGSFRWWYCQSGNARCVPLFQASRGLPRGPLRVLSPLHGYFKRQPFQPSELSRYHFCRAKSCCHYGSHQTGESIILFFVLYPLLFVLFITFTLYVQLKRRR